jgi:hypothetical protein
MEASSAGKREYGRKGRRVKYWARLNYWISPCYGPFSLGVLKLTKLLFKLFNFPLFSGRSERWLNETSDNE